MINSSIPKPQIRLEECTESLSQIRRDCERLRATVSGLRVGDTERAELLAVTYRIERGVRTAMSKPAPSPEQEWIARYPNYCRACNGWGGSTFYENHGLQGGGEYLLDPCGALDPWECHRCGGEGLTIDAEGPCSLCGWDYDDGIPEPDIEPMPDELEPME